MTKGAAPVADDAGRPRRKPSLAWQLALAQEFGGTYPFEYDAADGRVLGSPALKALLGLDPEDALAAGDVVLRVASDTRRALMRAALSSLRSGSGFEVEFRIALADGSARWILARGRTLGPGPAGRIAGVGVDITRHKEAEHALAEKEAALRASEARFRAVQETSIDGFMMLDSVRDDSGALIDFRWVYANDAAERIVGRPREWFIGRRLLVEMPGNREAGLFDAYARVLATGEPWSREFFYRHEGLEVYLRAVAGRVGDGVAVTFADLSERRRAEQKVIAAEERWRAILNTMPQMVWSAQPDGRHDFYNDRWYEFTGAERGSTDGDGWIELLHPEDREKAKAQWTGSLESGRPYQVEHRMRHQSGAWRWTLGRAVPIRDSQGRIERWFGTSTDIDDLKATEARLQLSEERLQLALDAAEVVGTWSWDLVSDRVYADARFSRLFGVDPARGAEGVPIESFLGGIHPEDRARVQAAIREAVATGERYNQDYRLLPADGRVIWVSARGQCLHEDGRPVRFPGAAFDITERKLVEEARELLARELSHRIKNIFAVINSLVTLSVRGDDRAADFADTLRARLTALGRAHDFVRPSSEGEVAPGQTAHGLFCTLLEPYQRAELGRIVIDGCDAAVGMRSATALALVVHELATNAVKYGALCKEDGRVTLACAELGDSYRIVWRERGGPPVAGPPERQGFGTFMSRRTVAAQLRAEVVHDWDPAGLTVTLTLPREELAQ